MNKRFLRLFLIAVVACVGSLLSRSAEADPPTEVCSADKQYCVRIIGTHGHPDECTLRISSQGRTLAEFPTFGYLLDVFFSPNSNHVAINNRRGNSGDYLWVISLRDGKPLKIPDEVADDLGKKELAQISGDYPFGEIPKEVNKICPKCADREINHGFRVACRWKSPTELIVADELETFYGWITINKVCRINGNKLFLAEQAVKKETEPSELVRRAWTWNPFHFD